MDLLTHYQTIWLVDFEFSQPDGEQPEPICMVARDYRGGDVLRIWQDDLCRMDSAPFDTGAESLFVPFYGSAEFICFRSLNWPMPARVLDLFPEFRCLTNGTSTPCGNGLLGALTYFGLGSIESAEKDEMRQLAMRGGPYTDDEKSDLLDYCQTDVDALARLLPAMVSKIDLPRALLRGRYMVSAAAMEFNGVPIDVETLNALRANWEALKGRLTQAVNRDCGVWQPAGRYAVDPSTRVGREVIAAAESAGCHPYYVMQALDEVFQIRSQDVRERRDAVEIARRRTGLTVNRISRIEDSGRDHTSVVDLDVVSVNLAGDHPELGIGSGYQQDSGYDDADYSGRLWDLLREPTERLPKRSDDDILAEATELAMGSPTEPPDDIPWRFSRAAFAEFLIQRDIPWYRLDSGELALDDDTFKEMARSHPEVSTIRELRNTLGEMRLFTDLAVGSDGRNRCLLSCFRATSGRNAPSNARFIFGPSCWLRSLIKPPSGWAVAYCDWSQQEFGIAAALSGDPAMMEAYASGDPYLTFAKQANAIPPDGTKRSHPEVRDLFKTCALGVQYGMGEFSLARRINRPPAYARELLMLHRATYPRFWRWSEAAVNHAMLRGWLQTVFGWRVHVGSRANPRSLANFPMQANGAEMLRLACCLLTENGIHVCAPVHDAVLVEAPIDEIDDVVRCTQAYMAEASRVTLDGFELRSDAVVVCHPDRYIDPRGRQMWETVSAILDELKSEKWVETESEF